LRRFSSNALPKAVSILLEHALHPLSQAMIDALRCPDCGCPLQSLDLPCPQCAVNESSLLEITTHSYSKSFEYRPGPFKYRPDEFAETINRWLADQKGLQNVTMAITLYQVRIKTVTINCLGSNSPESLQFRLTRVPLNTGQIGRKLLPAGEALNNWMESNPNKRQITFWYVASGRVPFEVWLLYVEKPLPG
jgi:hypothetical protein